MRMESLILVVSYAMVLAIPLMIQAKLAQGPKEVEKWVDKMMYKKEKVTKLHFYVHNKAGGGGENQNTWQVAKSNITFTSSSFFGLVEVADDLLTEGPDPKSKAVGRAQGLFASSSLSEVSYTMAFNLVFTKGEYENSTLSLQGWNPVFHEYREMAIVGGSGVFRLARGLATAKNYFVNIPMFHSIIEYDVVVLHY